MKWFKHMSCSHTDEKLCKLTDAYGLEGYGFYWFMLEKVSSIMDATGHPEVTYSVKKWSSSLDVPAQTFKKLMQKCCELGLFLCEFRSSSGEVQHEFVGRNNELLLTVKIPNLLKYRDNYSQDKKRNLEASSKNVPSKEVEEEVEEEVKKKYLSSETAEPPRTSVSEKAFDDEIVSFVTEFQNRVATAYETLAPKVTDKLIRDGSDAIDKCVRLDGLSLDEVTSAVKWAMWDGFWSKNVRSLAQIRSKGNNGLSKIQNVINAYRNSQVKASSVGKKPTTLVRRPL